MTLKKGERKKEEPKKRNNVKNIISIILGAVSILASFFFPYIVLLTATVGIIFAYVEKGKGFEKSNIWAFVLNLIGFVFALAIVILAIAAIIIVGNNPNILNLLNNSTQ